MRDQFWRVDIAAGAVAPLAALLLYLSTLDVPFFFDDVYTVLRNWSLYPWASIGNTVTTTRPLLNLSYWLTFQVSGRAPWAHHAGNIAFHVANAALVFAWIRLALLLPRFARWREQAGWLPVAVSLLFAVHPLQTEVVTYISGRSEAVAAFFVLAAMLLLVLSLRWDKMPWRSRITRAGAIVSVVCGMLSKENAAVAPLALLLFEILAGDGGLRATLRRHWAFYSVLATCWLVPAAILLAFPRYANTAGLGFAASEYGIRPLPYLYTQFGVIAHYLRLTIVPVGQVFDYEWPVATEFLQPGVIGPALLLLALLAGGLAAWRRLPLAAYGVAWFFLTLAPTSSFVPIADVVAERRMYLPVIGLLLALCSVAGKGASRLGQGRRHRVALAAAIGLAAVSCAALTWRRNVLWHDPVAFWEDAAHRQVGNPRIHANLATSYAQQGKLYRARAELELAARLIHQGRSRHAIPRHAAFVYTHLASVSLRLGEENRARLALREALAAGAEYYDYLRPRLKRVQTALAESEAARSPRPRDHSPGRKGD